MIMALGKTGRGFLYIDCTGVLQSNMTALQYCSLDSLPPVQYLQELLMLSLFSTVVYFCTVLYFCINCISLAETA